MLLYQALQQYETERTVENKNEELGQATITDFAANNAKFGGPMGPANESQFAGCH